MQPLYTPDNTKPAYELNWGLTVFWRTTPVPDSLWLAALQQATEPDGVRIIKHQLTTGDASQFFVSTKPHVAPQELIRSVKGRLQHEIGSRVPKALQRNYCLRGIGAATREVVERYVADQLGHHRMADPNVQQRLSSVSKIVSGGRSEQAVVQLARRILVQSARRVCERRALDGNPRGSPRKTADDGRSRGCETRSSVVACGDSGGSRSFDVGLWNRRVTGAGRPELYEQLCVCLWDGGGISLQLLRGNDWGVRSRGGVVAKPGFHRHGAGGERERGGAKSWAVVAKPGFHRHGAGGERERRGAKSWAVVAKPRFHRHGAGGERGKDRAKNLGCGNHVEQKAVLSARY